MEFPRLQHPIVLAPMAGGPSTPALAAAVSGAGGFGMIAAGFRTAQAFREDVQELRRLTAEPFGANLFVPQLMEPDAALVSAYVASLEADASAAGVRPGEPRHDDDAWRQKLDVVIAGAVPVVSFTFGAPSGEVTDELHRSGSAVWVSVTSPEEAVAAAESGADALVVQGFEAGGHRGSFERSDDLAADLGLLALLRLVARVVDLPLVAAGGIMDGPGVAAALAAGARAAQLGTAFLRTAEAGTHAAHREALARGGRTALTRAFTGRAARGIENRFMREHSDAPRAYPDVHYATSPLRAAARARGDAEGVSHWAGQAFELGGEEAAGDLVRRLGEEAVAALRDALAWLDADAPSGPLEPGPAPVPVSDRAAAQPDDQTDPGAEMDARAEAIDAHYGRAGLADTILDRLREAGLDPDRLDPDDLAPMEEFHTGGRDTTIRLADAAEVEGGMRVLDVGAGIGGPARLLARRYGCVVTALDLTEEFCRTAEILNALTGLSDRVSVREGNALELPFADGGFDLVWTQHASMNIEDKERLYAEMRRMLAPGGRLALFDYVAGEGGPPYFPVPWAEDPAISHLRPAEEIRAILAASGFRELSWDDVSDSGVAFARRMGEAPAPRVGLGLLVSDMPAKLANVLRALEDGRLRLVQAVLEAA